MEVPEFHLTFQKARFLHGVGRKGGDVIVAAAAKGADLIIYKNQCKVEGREKQHDPMFFHWYCRSFSRAEPPVPPATPAIGATEHTEDNEEVGNL